MKRRRPGGADEWEGGASGGGGKESGGTSHVAAPGAAVHTVYLEGLPYTASEDDIRRFLSGVEPILSIRAPRYQDSGRLMGYAHVDVGTKAAMTAALGKDGAYLGGRFISVAAARPVAAGGDVSMAFSTTPRPAGCTTIFVKGLPYDTTEAAVQETFTRFGGVASVRLARWNHTHRLKGFGYVQFEQGHGAEAAVKAYRAAAAAAAAGEAPPPGGGLKVGGRVVHVDYDGGAPKLSFKTETGQQFARTEVGKKLALHPSAPPSTWGSSGKRSKAAAIGAAREGEEEEGGWEGGEDGGAAAAKPKKRRNRDRKDRGEVVAADLKAAGGGAGHDDVVDTVASGSSAKRKRSAKPQSTAVHDDGDGE